ncbi:hypothetical protein COLO4_12067 [Corchorus olitorius]|uniref:Sugar phosphate transporter domain-containing protein n=1 Tax=Corchorus olitorius TaxID=93759 RepID=A0A1R3K294_9ROSI|nr:hypothetical protein COLO4_12067 [Corchorus olitorius]
MQSMTQILGLLLSKDVTKQNHGDHVATPGRAMESNQSSLFDKLQSSESTKQRISAPLAALTFNLVVAVGIIFMNKWVLKSVGFEFPVFLTVIHCAMAKLAITPLIVLMELHGTQREFLSPSLFGACVALAWIIPSAVNKILWSNVQQLENWTALALMWKTTPITLFFLVLMIPFLDPPGALAFHWSLSNTSAILMSAFLGFLLQWSSALTLGATSAISSVVLGEFKTCVILLGNYYLFGANPGSTSVFGAFIAIAGMSFYTYLNLHAMKRQSSKGNKENHNAYGAETV